MGEKPEDNLNNNISKRLGQFADIELPDNPEVDSQGAQEAEIYGSLDRETQEYSSKLRKIKVDTALAEQEADKISQQSRRVLLKCLKWPLILGVIGLVLFALILLVILIYVGGNILYLVTTKSPAQIYQAIVDLGDGTLFVGLVAPIGVLVAAVAAWLLKQSKKQS